MKATIARKAVSLLCAGALALGGAGMIVGTSAVAPADLPAGVEKAQAAGMTVKQQVKLARYVDELIPLEKELAAINERMEKIPAEKVAAQARLQELEAEYAAIEKDLRENPGKYDYQRPVDDDHWVDPREDALVTLDDGEIDPVQDMIYSLEQEMAELEKRKPEIESRIAELNRGISTIEVKSSNCTALKVRAKKGRKAALSWKAPKGVKGLSYQVKYKVAGKRAKTVTAKGTSKKLSKLAAGKKYTFKVRGFKKIGGKTVYTRWSASKTAKVRK